MHYRERLFVPLRWWAQATMLVASAWLALLVSTPGWVTLLGTAVAVAVATALLLWIGSARVEVSDTGFRAGTAQIPRQYVGQAVALDPEQTRRVFGVDADARAWLVTRPYLKRAVKVEINDPADPTPYWLVCSRRPEALADALNQARPTADYTHRTV
ncbi:MAG TPA: DUF3093 domain-containing protein [Marmoricola sp.]|nr:DUF3093 domain-containing protein [Marmoricola sp.]